MAHTIFTRALARAAEVQGSTQALASSLRVPESTLLRWMSGRAQMPLRAALRLIELLNEFEAQGKDVSLQEAATDKLAFTLDQSMAHCARCECTEFVLEDSSATVRFTSMLRCHSCSERVIYGNLIAKLAKDNVRQSPARTEARRKQVRTLTVPAPYSSGALTKSSTGRDAGS